MERHCTIGDIAHLGRAWVLPAPRARHRRHRPDGPRRRDRADRRRGWRSGTRQARGWRVESVEAENRGFDLISRKPHPHDDKTFIEVRFIEVKGRAGVGEIALSDNEYKTAERLKDDYWLYVGLQLRDEAGAAHDPGPGAARLGAGGPGRALPYRIRSDP